MFVPELESGTSPLPPKFLAEAPNPHRDHLLVKPLSPQSRAKAIAVTGLLVLVDSSWSQELPEQPKPAPAPLKADPARDLYEAAQLAYAEAKNARKKAARKIAYENSQRTFERFLKAFPHDRRVPQARFYLASCYDNLGNKEKSFQT